MAKSKYDDLSKKELQNKLNNLEKEVATLKKQNTKGGAFMKLIKSISVWVLVLICAVTLNLSVAAGWLKKNIIDTDTWTAKTSAILQDKDFQNQLANRITDEIFAATDAESAIKEFVPPRASALSVPLTQSLRSYTNEKVVQVIASDKFQTYWYDLNYSAHEGIITSIENGGKKPDNTNYVMYIEDEKVLLNLNPIVNRVQDDLASSGLNFVGAVNLDNVKKTITVTEINSMPSVLYAFNVLNKGAIVLFVLAVVSGGAAIALARDKRKTIMALSALIIVLMVLNVQAIFFARAPLVQQASNSLQSSTSSAATSVFDILTKDLITYNRILVLFSIIVFVTAVMTGPSKFASFVRKKVAGLTSNKNNKYLTNLENNATSYVGLLGVTYAVLIIFGLLKNATFAVILLVLFCLISFWLLSIKKD
jgi:hypothetical protein